MGSIGDAIIKLVQQQMWAIRPEVLDVIHSVLYARYYGNGVDINAVEAQIGGPLDNKYDAKTEGSIAIIPIHGVIAKRMNMMSEISGGVSAEIVQSDIQSALNNSDIDAIVLDIDSPGGMVAGTMELANTIYEARGKKPILAAANETCCSAAYWIASAADNVYAYNTSEVGSIGVVAKHYDYSKANETDGVKVTYIYAGKYKTIGNSDEPLDKDAKNILQSQIDDLYIMFVNNVARNRGISTEKVLKDMADGRVFLAKEALERGLIDGIMSLDDVIGIAAKRADDIRRDRRIDALANNVDAMLTKRVDESNETTVLHDRVDALLEKYGR